MSRSADVLVIGGGVIGASIAYHLAKEGVDVLVLERDSAGGRASRAAAGMLATQAEAGQDAAFLRECVASRDLFRMLAPEVRGLSGVDPEWSVTGLWRLAAGEAEAAQLADKATWDGATRWFPAVEAKTLLPGMNVPFGASLSPEDGMVNPILWARALALAAQRRGARVQEFSSALTLALSAGRVAGAVVAGERFSAGTVVLASGAWAPDLLGPLGVSLPLEPIKGQILVASGPAGAFRAPMYAGDGYLAPRADGRVLIGSTSERAGFDERPTDAGRDKLKAWAVRWSPYLAGMPVVGVQVGLRPGSKDGLPLIGPAPGVEGLVLALGHHRNGILLSPLTGRRVSEGLRGEGWPALFRPDRFTSREVQPA